MSMLETTIRPWRVPPASRTADAVMSDGARIRLRQYGHTGARRLVLSHGNGLAIDAYLPFWLPLAADFELVVFDIRNHGENPQHDPAGHRWDRLARDMGEIQSAIAAEFGAVPTIGVFHSLSAVAAVAHALEAGAPWGALALFDPPLCPPPGHPLEAFELADVADRASRARRRPEHYASPDEFAAQLRRLPAFGGWVAGAHQLFAEATLRRHANGNWSLRNPRELEARIYETNIDPTLWSRLTQLACPTILIGADPTNPHATPPAACCRALHDEQGMAYTMIPDTSHFLQIEKPEACRQALVDFVARLD